MTTDCNILRYIRNSSDTYSIDNSAYKKNSKHKKTWYRG